MVIKDEPTKDEIRPVEKTFSCIGHTLTFVKENTATVFAFVFIMSIFLLI